MDSHSKRFGAKEVSVSPDAPDYQYGVNEPEAPSRAPADQKIVQVSLPLAQLPGCIPHTTNFVLVRGVAITVVVKSEYQLLQNLSLQNA